MARKKSARRSKLFVPVIAIALTASTAGIALYLFLYAPTKSEALENVRSALYPFQYSDRHITENAIRTDERFRNTSPVSQKDLLASVIGEPPSHYTGSASSTPERGTWLWTPLLEISPAQRSQLLDGAAQNGIRVIYLSLDSYLDIYVLPDGREKEAQQKAFDTALAAFITQASRRGIAVDAEGGWRNWAVAGNTYKAFALLEYAKAFNATHTQKLRSFQYDIEPYLLDDYAQHKPAVLTDYLDLINDTVSRLDGSDLQFAVVIPDFYDATDGETPEFLYGFSYGSTLDHLLGILERRPESKLIVMSYRNHSDGDDGSIAISRDEIKRADRFHTKVIIAQETGEVQPSSFTFYRMNRSYLDSQTEKIEETFAQDPSFNGIAVHYLNAFLALK